MKPFGAKNKSESVRFKTLLGRTVRKVKFDPIKTMLDNLVYLTPYQQTLVSMRILNIMHPPAKGGLDAELDKQTRRLSEKSPMTPEEIDSVLHNEYEPISPNGN